MISLILAVALLGNSVTGVKASSFAHSRSQRLNVTISPFNPSGMPVRINTATAENSVGASWVEYSVTNLSGEEIHGIHLRLFTADSQGKLIKVRDSFSGESIAARATQMDRAQVKGTVKPQMISFIAVIKVITESGVWKVDDSALETAIQSKLNHLPEVTPSATFQSNASIAEGDRGKIFELILANILEDEKKAARLQNQSRVIVLRDTVNFDLPRIPQANLIALDLQEIQRIANMEQRVIFLSYEPLTSVGSRVLAKIALRDAVARRSGMRVPYKFTFLFTCVKENGRWIVEKSIGYAQS